MVIKSGAANIGSHPRLTIWKWPEDLALHRSAASGLLSHRFATVPDLTQNALASLKEKLLTMASYAEAAVNRAVKSLVRRDDDLARQTREEDDRIDSLEKEIDNDAVGLLGQQPGPFNLRFILIAMKISQNLERVGDEATTISRRVIDLSNEPQLKQADSIPPMAALAVRMLKDALDAFVNRDPATAVMMEKPAAISRGLNLMVICKSLERIADHATNVAEEVVFLYEGEDIRHLDLDRPPSTAPAATATLHEHEKAQDPRGRRRT